jgi:hypothetical protein
MEVLLGFAVGYWVGTRQGREGLDRALGAARDIWASPQARRLLDEGLPAASSILGNSVLRSKGRGTRVAIIRGVIDEVVERRRGPQGKAA